jgi:hypothetical protein
METSSDDQKGDRVVETRPDPDEYEEDEDDYYSEWGSLMVKIHYKRN